MSVELKNIFDELDQQKEGRLSTDKVVILLSRLGHNIYKGSVAKIARMLNYSNEQDQASLNFDQVSQYCKALESKGTYEIWKAKHQLIAKVYKIKQQSKAAQSQIVDKGQSGQLKVIVGDVSHKNSQYIQLKVEKKQKGEDELLITIKIETSEKNYAQRIKELILQIYQYFTSIIIAEEPDFENQIKQIVITTQIVEDNLLIYLKTINKSIIQLALIASRLIDESIDRTIEATFHFKFDFNFEAEKFLKNYQYDIYNLFVRNCALRIKWNGSQFISALKQTLLMNAFFQNLSDNPTSMKLLTIIAALSLQQCQVQIIFDNTDVQKGQQQVKNQFINMFKQIKIIIDQFEIGKQLAQLLLLLSGKINIKFVVGAWNAQLNLYLKDLAKLIVNIQEVVDPNKEEYVQENS